MLARITRALFITALTLCGLGSLTGPAPAHDQLISSTPADGDSLGEAPSTITLTFNADIAAIGSQAVVTAPDGSDVAGDIQVSGTVVTVALNPDLTSGSYQTTWRVTSSDGHPIEGSFAFTLDVPAESVEAPSDASPTEDAATTAAASPIAATPLAEPADEETTETAEVLPDASSLPGWLIPVIAIGVVGTLVALLVRLRRSSRLRE